MSESSLMIKVQAIFPLATNDFIAYSNLVVSGMCMHWPVYTIFDFVEIDVNLYGDMSER